MMVGVRILIKRAGLKDMLGAKMIREIYHFPRLDGCDQVLCFDTTQDRFYIRSVVKNKAIITAIASTSANVLMLYAINRKDKQHGCRAST